MSNKNEDVETAVEVISGLHQRFNESFTVPLMSLYLQNFNLQSIENANGKEGSAFTTQVKNNLRIFTELYLVNVFTSIDEISEKELPGFLSKKNQKKESVLLTILKETLNYNFKLGYSTIIGSFFVKKFPDFFDDGDTIFEALLPDADLKKNVNTIFTLFTNAVSANAIKLQKQCNKLLKEHHKCQIRTGKATDEFLEKYEEISPIFERFKTSALTLTDALNIETPQFEVDEVKNESESQDSMITNKIVPPSQRLWENEEARKFYEVLPDINEIVSSSNLTKQEPTPEKLNEFFEDLRTIESKKALDELVIKYWSNKLDNKATRNRLLKFFSETQDWSKLNLYARFLAINRQYMKESIDEFIEYLDNGFRSQIHNTKFNIKNVIFFGEMVKFMLLPEFIIFHKIRSLIINMNVTHNVEILTILFENCGKVLLNKMEYKEEMDKLVDRLKTRKLDQQLNMNVKASIDTLLTILFPPSAKSLNGETIELSPEEKFYTVLLRSELGNINFRDTIRLIRKAHWKNSEIQNLFFSLFTEPVKIRYQDIPIITQVLSGLYNFNRNFAIKCIDQVLENVEMGLESNNYSDNTTRIANSRYLTEIFNYEMMKSNVLLDCVYHILRYGHQNGQPNPFHLNDSDLPNNYFRIHLVTTILLNIRRTPTSLTKNLALLLRFLEYYIFTKEYPLPKETQFAVENTFEKLISLLPKKEAQNFERSTNMLESLNKFQAYLILTNGKPTLDQSSPPTNGLLEEHSGDDDVSADENDDPNIENDEGVGILDDFEILPESVDVDIEEDINPMEQSSDSEISVTDSDDDITDDNSEDSDDDDNSDEDTDDDSDDDSDDYSEEEDETFKNFEAERDAEQRRIIEEYQKKLQSEEEIRAQEELDKQFNIMMNESLEARKNESVSNDRSSQISGIPGFNRPLPEETSGSLNGKKMAFTFLTKSGKKTQSRVLNLSKDIGFVSNVIEEGEKLRSEREKIKNIVLKKTFD
ncbi:Nonsense-mediated mRNA decay protein 2 [Nakaseomyces bracarensis]|uniref:Nonsense-mediated mRNA decay protein 2 n=1 Tax=Nakaseomyces bracarensis TaxID=273131 RepID=A0ABR4NZV4_9SACH